MMTAKTEAAALANVLRLIFQKSNLIDLIGVVNNYIKSILADYAKDKTVSFSILYKLSQAKLKPAKDK